jgi:hypothetical protein
MDTDVNHSLPDQEGTKNLTWSGPDINKLAGDFSSGVKFSPRVKSMMDQSRIELTAFINSLSSSATAAEFSPVVAVAEPPAALEKSVAVSASSADGEGTSPAAATRAPLPGNTLAADPVAAGDVRTPPPATFSAHLVVVSYGMADDSAVIAEPPYSSPAKNSFRASRDSSGEVFQGSETPASPILASEGAAQLYSSQRDDGCSSLEETTTSSPECEKLALHGKVHH